jgi:predicted hydrocarbon binding protein/KaiC/GvpD/RAD55 family RecA-like ATPase
MVSLTELQEIPSENMILLVAPPGSGKTSFCEQIILQNLAVDRSVIYVMTKYSPSKAEQALKQRGLENVEPGLLSFIDAYSATVGVPVIERSDTVYADCNDLSSIDIAITKLQERIGKKGILLIFDSLTSPYLFNESEILKFLTQTLSRFAARRNSVMACIDEGCGKPEHLVAMMGLSDGVIKMETEEDKQFLNVIKHTKMKPTRIEATIEPQHIRQLHFDESMFDVNEAKQYMDAMVRGDEAWLRKEVGDYVNLFWTNLVHWSGMLWDPKRFPMMKYELNKEEESMGYIMFQFFPLHIRLLFKFLPKNLSKVKDMKKMLKIYLSSHKTERSGITEYLEDVSKTDEHYIRVDESLDCWGLENVDAAMALYLPSVIAGSLRGFEVYRGGPNRDWNAVETKCIGRGDPYCEIKVVPGEINELKTTLESLDSTILEKIHTRLIGRLMGFLLEGKPLVERPTLGSDIHLHAVRHTFGFPNLAGERYQTALRMGGAKAGKEVGEHLMEAGKKETESIKLFLQLLEHCKVGKVTLGETMRIEGNCENALTKLLPLEIKEPSCYFTTGFSNGFFSAVKNQHVKETKCIAMGDPYCEWEFR